MLKILLPEVSLAKYREPDANRIAMWGAAGKCGFLQAVIVTGALYQVLLCLISTL